jgi:hypothetical protein
VLQEGHQVPQLDRFPIRNPLPFRPGHEFVQESGVGALGVLGLSALVAEVLKEVFNQGVHRVCEGRVLRWGSRSVKMRPMP